MAINDATLLAMLKSSGMAGGGGYVSVRGNPFYAIFDNGFADALNMIESSDPSLTCRTSDVVDRALVKDDVIEGLTIQYRVKKIEHDGTGMTRVVLKL